MRMHTGIPWTLLVLGLHLRLIHAEAVSTTTMNEETSKNTIATITTAATTITAKTDIPISTATLVNPANSSTLASAATTANPATTATPTNPASTANPATTSTPATTANPTTTITPAYPATNITLATPAAFANPATPATSGNPVPPATSKEPSLTATSKELLLIQKDVNVTMKSTTRQPSPQGQTSKPVPVSSSPRTPSAPPPTPPTAMGGASSQSSTTKLSDTPDRSTSRVWTSTDHGASKNTNQDDSIEHISEADTGTNQSTVQTKKGTRQPYPLHPSTTAFALPQTTNPSKKTFTATYTTDSLFRLCKERFKGFGVITSTLKGTEENDRHTFTAVTLTANPVYGNMKKEEHKEIPTLIIILASCGGLAAILFAFAVYCTCHRRSYRKNQQHLTEELHTVENGYHDNPTLEVMEVQPEMQEKKLPLNCEFNDSWMVPLDNLAKEDIPDEEDTHL